MAHQCDIIPWQRLAEILQFNFEPNKSATLSAITFGQDTESVRDEVISDFIHKFDQAIKDQTKEIQARYPPVAEVPGDDDMVLSDEVLTRIMPTVEPWAKYENCDEWEVPEPRVTRRYEAICAAGGRDTARARECLVPLHRRKMNAFFARRRENDCFDFGKINGKANFQVQLVESLLLEDEMETLLRICRHDKVHYHDWTCYKNCYCMSSTQGWGELYSKAFKAYLVLNILYAINTREDNVAASKNQLSYRDLTCYQDMLAHCLDYSGISTSMHEDFWEIGICLNNRVPGDMRKSLRHFIAFHRSTRLKSVHFPPVNLDIGRIRCLLRRKRLPTELATEIMQQAGFIGKPGSKLIVPWDPFHALNRQALRRYLDRCWQLIVRCNVMWEALDRPAMWDDEGHDYYEGDLHIMIERWPAWGVRARYLLYSMSKEIGEHFCG